MTKLTITDNCNLKEYHTFGMNVTANKVVHLQSKEEIQSFIAQKQDFPLPYLPLGAGSNMLFTKDFEGTLLRSEMNYIETIYEDDEMERILVGAGVVWDDFVIHCVEQGLFGAENLKAIPGTVGAAPVQNIGAYGAEVKDLISAVIAYRIEDGELLYFTNEDCKFSYRNSIFKGELKNQLIISEVIFELQKEGQSDLSYGTIKECLTSKDITDPTPKELSQCIQEIRDSKLPDPEEFGNAGSFFKNPMVSNVKAKELKLSFPNIPIYKVDESRVKIAAGWLIDQLGWKGKTQGGAAVHTKQALVLINKNEATPSDVVLLSQAIIDSVKEKYGIELEPEVNFIA